MEEAVHLLTSSSKIEGVTFLGGEPFAQAEALCELAHFLKQRGLSILSYSGFTLEELKNQGRAQRELLDYCDLLVDGEFIQAQAGPFLWRGSKNQEIHFLSSRYLSWKERIDGEYRDFEVLMEEGQLVLTGDPPPEMLEVMRSLAGLGSNRDRGTGLMQISVNENMNAKIRTGRKVKSYG